VEGRDSLSVEHVLDTASASVEDPLSGELKTACYVPPTQCSVAVRRAVEPTLVTRGTSPMSTSDMDVLPDISALLTSGTETDDVDDVMTMIGAPCGASWSSLSDLVAGGCDAELDSSSDGDLRRASLATPPPPPRRLYSAAASSTKSPWTARKPRQRVRQRDAVLEPDVYYC